MIEKDLEIGSDFRIELVRAWEEEPIVDLYRAGGWWSDEMDPSRIGDLIEGSFLFSVAVEASSGTSVGMGRAISDGVSDAYIQDLVVLPGWRRHGIGQRIVSKLLEGCQSRGIKWVGLIAGPGTEEFYRSIGFEPMKGYVPMLHPVSKC